MGNARRSHARALMALLLVAVALVLGAGAATLTAPAAGAHATVTASSPKDQERFPSGAAPAGVAIEFSEPITAAPGGNGGLRVLDRTGGQVDQKDSHQPTPTSLHVTLPPGLPDGSYVANYQVISADGHPINGGIVFLVGSGNAADVSGVTAKIDPTYDTLSKVGQFLTYVGALGAAGLAFFLAFLHRGPAGTADRHADAAPAALADAEHAERRRVARLARWSAAIAVVGMVAVVVAQAAQTTGGGPGSVFTSGTLSTVLRQGLGSADGMLLVGLAVCLGALAAGSRTSRSEVAERVLAALGGAVVATSFVLWGHAVESSRRALAVSSDVIHGAAAAVWLGGLVGVALVLRMRTRGDGRSERTLLRSAVVVVRRFSGAATVSIVALTIAGVGLSVAMVGSFGKLVDTAYGITLLVKLGLVAVILFVAAYNRFFLLPWLFETTPADRPVPSSLGAAARDELADDPAGDEGDVVADDVDHDSEIEAVRAGWRTLARTTTMEIAGILAVLAVTSILVITPPASEVKPGTTTPAETNVPFHQTKPLAGGTVRLMITPNAVGKNSFHLDMLGADGKPADLGRKVQLQLALPEQNVGPFTREMIKAGTGHFILENVNDLSIAGNWKLTLLVRVSDFDEQRVEFQDQVS